LEAESTRVDSMHWKILSGSSVARLIMWQITWCCAILGTKLHTFCMTTILSGFQA
jgi:hypothetical protein